MEPKEADMPSTLNPACPLCGLQYANRPLLELHIREDHHPQRNRPTSQTTETIPMTETPAPRQSHPGWTRTALRRVIGRLKTLNDEFLRVPATMVRPARAPQRGPQPDAPAGQDAPAA
jgi:hypothetical protein